MDTASSGCWRGRAVVDPRVRGELGLQPEVDPRLMRVSALRIAPRPLTHPLEPAAERGEEAGGVLVRPSTNSSRYQAEQIRQIAEARFDADVEILNLSKRDPEEIRRLRSRVAGKSVNVGGTEPLFTNLIPISAASTESQPYVEKTRLPRAKKTLSKAWLDFKENRPRFEDTWAGDLEVDSISLPYPQLSYNPFEGIPNRHGDEGFKPSVSIASLTANLEDVHRREFFERPLEWDDLY
ncbi:hypothetical protein HDU67_000473 [Dinochytrium kinnereticum]|nr:hypothetical protein HDU67_000473 [Dinochytrium kinnereticum]